MGEQLITYHSMANGVESICKVEVNQVKSFSGVYQPFYPFLSSQEFGEADAVWNETMLR